MISLLLAVLILQEESSVMAYFGYQVLFYMSPRCCVCVHTPLLQFTQI